MHHIKLSIMIIQKKRSKSFTSGNQEIPEPWVLKIIRRPEVGLKKAREKRNSFISDSFEPYSRLDLLELTSIKNKELIDPVWMQEAVEKFGVTTVVRL
jgi:hypothetical protein